MKEKVKITGLPRGGINFREWTRSDVARWWQLIRADHHTTKDKEDIERLRKQYKLNRFYKFN